MRGRNLITQYKQSSNKYRHISEQKQHQQQQLTFSEKYNIILSLWIFMFVNQILS